MQILGLECPVVPPGSGWLLSPPRLWPGLRCRWRCLQIPQFLRNLLPKWLRCLLNL